MNKMIKIAARQVLILGLISSALYAGNPQRAGSAGAQELLINPWVGSSGWAGANTAAIQGPEALWSNVAGAAFTKKTAVVFSHINWLAGSDIQINSLGFTQKVGERGVLGFSLMVMDFGEIEITTTELPEGGLGRYSPQYLNIGLSYARKFTNSIYGGITLRLISESIGNLDALGMAFDAGVQYVTGSEKHIRFGISLKNIGPSLSFEGDGMALPLFVPGGAYSQTVEQRSQDFELPSHLNIGASYDLLMEAHRLRIAGNFTSHAFHKDQYMLGLEYAFKERLMLRAGYSLEDNGDEEELLSNTTALRGFSAGFGFEAPLGKRGTVFGIDYSYRTTISAFDGVHSVGLQLRL